MVSGVVIPSSLDVLNSTPKSKAKESMSWMACYSLGNVGAARRMSSMYTHNIISVRLCE